MAFNINNAKVVVEPTTTKINNGDYKYVINMYKDGLTVYSRIEMSIILRCRFKPEKREANRAATIKLYRSNKVIDNNKNYVEEEVA